MKSSYEDLLDLSDHAWQRLWDRLAGLTDAEYHWEPVANCRGVRPIADGRYRSDGPAEAGDDRTFTTLAWRLCHIVDFLTEQRNGPWLGQPATPPHQREDDPGTAHDALAALDAAYRTWRAVLAAGTEDTMAEPIGKPAGRYGSASRHSFALHVLDELIHHGAEAALLRDLYPATLGERPS